MNYCLIHILPSHCLRITDRQYECAWFSYDPDFVFPFWAFGHWKTRGSEFHNKAWGILLVSPHPPVTVSHHRVTVASIKISGNASCNCYTHASRWKKHKLLTPFHFKTSIIILKIKWNLFLTISMLGVGWAYGYLIDSSFCAALCASLWALGLKKKVKCCQIPDLFIY